MVGVSDQRSPPSLTLPSAEEELAMTPAPYIYIHTTRTPWKLSPSKGGSTLYDSYELRAVTQQLNRTIQGSQVMYSPCASHTKFTYPFRACLDRVYKENTRTPKRVTGAVAVGSTMGDDINLKGRRKFMPYLWKKLMRKFLGKKAPVWMCARNHVG